MFGEVAVLGLNIAYERAGSGPVVALAHGFVGDARSTWGSQIDALADEFTVVAWDAPGAGGSSDPPAGFGMDDYADCFAALLRALRIERAHLVGLSFGGALVLATFHRHRGLASSLSLVGGYAGWRGSLGAEDAQQRLARSVQVSELPPDEFAAVMVPSMFSPSADGGLVEAFVDSVRAIHPDGFRAMAGASFEDQSHVLPEVDVPTLLLYADHDVPATSLNDAERRARFLPAARSVSPLEVLTLWIGTPIAMWLSSLGVRLNDAELRGRAAAASRVIERPLTTSVPGGRTSAQQRRVTRLTKRPGPAPPPAVGHVGARNPQTCS